MDVKVVLGGLQDAIRRASEPEAAAAQASAYRKALGRLRRDERLRYVDGLDDLVRDFCVSCAHDKEFDYVPDLAAQLEQHASEVRTRVMLHPVVGLTVTEPVVLGEVELVLIEEWPGPPGVPALDPRVGALAKVSVRGSDARAMAGRARATVEDALAKLRLTAAGGGAINGQLLFHLDGFWVGDDGSHGWWMPPETVLELGVTPALLEPTRAHPVVGLPRPAANKAQQQAEFALMWLDHAMRSHDPLLRTVLPVFALEALLGDRSAGLKAKHLVFYRLMLSQVVAGHWMDPAAMYTTYEKIRSAAVHGSIPDLQLSDGEIRWLHQDLRDALAQYLTLCKQQNFTKRSKLLSWLAEHENAAAITEWLQERDPVTWGSWQPAGTDDELVADLLNLADDLSPQEAADFIHRVREGTDPQGE